MSKPTKAQILAQTNLDGLLAIWDGNTNCTDCVNCKRCSNCTGCVACEECDGSTNCVSCINVDSSTECVGCQNLGNAHKCSNCRGYVMSGTAKTRKLYACVNCENCRRCMFITGMQNQENVVMYVQLTAAEFNQVWAAAGLNGS